MERYHDIMINKEERPLRPYKSHLNGHKGTESNVPLRSKRELGGNTVGVTLLASVDQPTRNDSAILCGRNPEAMALELEADSKDILT